MSALLERVENLDANVAQYLKPCMKKPIPVKAVQMSVDFQVETLEGNYKQGKPGDYLMCGVFGELYICDKDVFEASYDWL
jgi:hypothetical protein